MFIAGIFLVLAPILIGCLAPLDRNRRPEFNHTTATPRHHAEGRPLQKAG